MVAAALVSAGVNLLGGLFGSKSAKKAAARQEALARQMEEQRVNAYRNYSTDLDQLARGYSFKPVTARTQHGTAWVDPTTGTVQSALGADLARQSSQFGQLGQLEFDQLMGLDRGGMAADRLAQLRELQAPGDIAAENAMVSRLQRMGMLGAAGASGSNPWVKALTESRATRDLQSAYDVTDWVERNIQQRMANMSGLYGEQRSVMDAGMKPFEVLGPWADRLQGVERERLGMLGGVAEARLNAALPGQAYYDSMGQANAARLQASQSMIRGVTGAVSGMIPGMFGGGYFGAYTTPVGMPSVERRPLY